MFSKYSRIHYGKLLFLLSKIVGLVVRPILIFFLLRFGIKDLASDFALVISAVASSFVILNNQNFKLLYDKFIGNEHKRLTGRGLGGRYLFQDYVEGTTIHVILFLPLAALVLYFWTKQTDLLFASLICILIEKYYDEDQRALVYKKEYSKWVVNYFSRVFLPAMTFVAYVFYFDGRSVFVYSIFCLSYLFLYCLVASKQYFRLYIICMSKAINKGLLAAFYRYYKSYKEKYFKAQLWIFITANVMFVDRFLINTFQPDRYAEYLLLVNIANIVATFHNMGHVSFNRPMLMIASVNISELQFALKNMLIPAVLSGLVLVGYFGFEMSGDGFGVFDKKIVFLLVGLYYVHAISFVPKELAFWNLGRGHLIVIDGLTIIFPILLTYIVSSETHSIISATIISLLLRYIYFYIVFSKFGNVAK